MDPVIWRLPGVQPLDGSEWLIRDDAFDAQMALRDQMLGTRRDAVYRVLPEAKGAAEECLDVVLTALKGDADYQVSANAVLRPDGVTVPIDRAQPLLTAGRLQQADLCLMEAGDTGHHLTGAVLCFPASWSLDQKIGRGLARIHAPVPDYQQDVERRVQRLFDAISPDRILWRMNAILHDNPALFAPKQENEDQTYCDPVTAKYVRSEFQTLRRLPKSKAVLFTIHTTMIATRDLSEDQRSTLQSANLKCGD